MLLSILSRLKVNQQNELNILHMTHERIFEAKSSSTNGVRPNIKTKQYCPNPKPSTKSVVAKRVNPSF